MFIIQYSFLLEKSREALEFLEALRPFGSSAYLVTPVNLVLLLLLVLVVPLFPKPSDSSAISEKAFSPTCSSFSKFNHI